MLDSLSRRLFLTLVDSTAVRRFVSRYGMREGSLVRRFIAGEALEDAIRTARRLTGGGLHCTFNYLGEEATSSTAARAAAETYIGMMRIVRAAGLPCQDLGKAHAAGVGA